MVTTPSDNDGSKDGAEEALSRFVAVTSGECGARERRDFALWAGTDASRGREIAEWSRLASDVETLAPHFAKDVRTLSRTSRRGAPLRWAVTAAAVCCAVLGLGFLATATRTIVADAGQPASIMLWDGTRIDLDAGAGVEVPYAPWLRQAALLRGDAVFEVVHEDGNPFVVRTGSAELRDLGTRFLVQSDFSGVKVTVYDGAVALTPKAGEMAMSLSAGQSAVLAQDGVPQRTAAVDEQTATGWRRGRLVFDDTPLSEVVGRLSRYQGGRVTIASSAVAGLRLTGSFDLNNRAELLRAIELSLPVRIRQVGAELVLEAAPPRKVVPPSLVLPR